MKKNILRIAAMVLVMAILLCACGEKDQTFSNNGLIMNMPANYERITGQDVSGFTFAMGNNKSICVGLKEDKATFEAYGYNLTLDEYTDLVIQANGLSTSVKYEGGIPTFTFVSVVDGQNFKYLAATFEARDAFWLIQFACNESKFDSMYDTFVNYMATVKV